MKKIIITYSTKVHINLLNQNNSLGPAGEHKQYWFQWRIIVIFIVIDLGLNEKPFF